MISNLLAFSINDSPCWLVFKAYLNSLLSRQLLIMFYLSMSFEPFESVLADLRIALETDIESFRPPIILNKNDWDFK